MEVRDALDFGIARGTVKGGVGVGLGHQKFGAMWVSTQK